MKKALENISTVTLAAAAFVLLTGYNSCDPVIENNGFDLWCGDELCTWELEKGDIARVPTWHTGDYGVDMIGNAVAISQIADIDDGDISCLRFDLVARIEETATVNLELDFYGDGSVEVTKQIPTSDFRKVSFLIRMPNLYDGILFRVSKTGSGRAVLAQIYADEATGCTDPPPVIGPRPLGASCTQNQTCGSEMCAPYSDGSGARVCSTCLGNDDCNAGEVCGTDFTEPYLPSHRACVPEAAKSVGMACGTDAECLGGQCVWGVCSSCETAADCNGGSCKVRAPALETGFWSAPHQCDPGEGGAALGEQCLIDSDCASGTCTGAGDLSVCEGATPRPCSNGGDCAGDLLCVTVGTSGGTCR